MYKTYENRRKSEQSADVEYELALYLQMTDRIRSHIRDSTTDGRINDKVRRHLSYLCLY